MGNTIVYSVVHGFESFGRLIDGVLEGLVVVSDRLMQWVSGVWQSETDNAHSLDR